MIFKAAILSLVSYLFLVESSKAETINVAVDTQHLLVSDLKLEIKKLMLKGYTTINFDKGSFRFPEKKDFNGNNRKKIKPLVLNGSLDFKIKLVDWLKKTNVRIVVIKIDNKLPAEAFFRLENQLSSHKIEYYLIAESAKPNTIILTQYEGVIASDKRLPDVPEVKLK